MKDEISGHIIITGSELTPIVTLRIYFILLSYSKCRWIFLKEPQCDIVYVHEGSMAFPAPICMKMTNVLRNYIHSSPRQEIKYETPERNMFTP